MFLKEHNISVRLPQEKTIDTGIVFVQNDKDVYKLNIRVFDGVYEIDYTEVEEATITFSKADGKVVQGDMQIEADQLTYVLGTNEIAAPGKLIATIQLLGANERLTTARFLFRVEKDLITEDAVKSTSEFPILQRLKEELEAIDVVDLTNQFNAHKADYAELKGYIGYTEDDIYGVEADFVNNKFTRLAGAIGKTPGADFDGINAFGGRKRCILTDDGVVLAYYGEPGYVETGKTTVEIKKDSVTYPVGTIVQVMVEQPKFYYKVVPLKLEKIQDGKGYHMRKARYYVSDVPKVGFKLHPAFISNGKEKDFIYLSAFEGSLFDVSSENYILNDDQIADFNADMLSSIANAKPISGTTQLLTRSNTRKLANNRGVGWEQAYAATISLTQLLLTIEYASMNSQAVIGNGVVGRPSGEGNEADITGLTTHLGNASGSVETGSVSYRGEENVWGNIWKWVDGINVYIDPETRKTDAYVADHGFTDDVKAEPYKDVGFSLASYSNGSYISAFGYNEEFDYLFLPSEVLGNSALPVGDAFYNVQTGWRVARLGGSWADSSNAGAFSWYVAGSSGSRIQSIGGRLVYIPQDEVA